jgi:hypothetical protein
VETATGYFCPTLDETPELLSKLTFFWTVLRHKINRTTANETLSVHNKKMQATGIS